MVDYTVPYLPPIRKSSEGWEADKEKTLKRGQIGIIPDKHALFVSDGTTSYETAQLIEHVVPIDNLTSTSITEPLSANQGRVLARDGAKHAIYVSSAGNDENSGVLPNLPFRTLDAAFDAMPENGEVVIRILTGGQFELTKSYTIRAHKFTLEGTSYNAEEDGGYPHISVSKDSTLEIENYGKVFIKHCNFERQMDPEDTRPTIDTIGIKSDRGAAFITLEDCSFSGFISALDVTGASVVIENCSFNYLRYILHSKFCEVMSKNNVSSVPETISHNFWCEGGTVTCVGTVPSSQDNSIVANGGRVYRDGNMTIVVDSNAISKGTQEKVKTLNEAVSLIPTHTNGEVTVSIKAIDNYEISNSFDISNKCLGGKLKISKADETYPTIKFVQTGFQIPIIKCENNSQSNVELKISGLNVESKEATNLAAEGIRIGNVARFRVEATNISHCNKGIFCSNVTGVSEIGGPESVFEGNPGATVTFTNISNKFEDPESGEIEYLGSCVTLRNTGLVQMANITAENSDSFLDSENSLFSKHNISMTGSNTEEKNSISSSIEVH